MYVRASSPGLVQQLSERYSLPLKTSYNTARGFFIQLYVGGGEGGGAGHTSLENLPSEFIKLSKQKSTLSFVTADLASTHYHNILRNASHTPTCTVHFKQ